MNSHEQLHAVLRNYFRGLFNGDVDLLRSVFHPDAALFGEVKGAPYHRELDDYLAVVASRQSPSKLGEDFRMEVVSLEVQGHVALAKAHCPMLGNNYVDYLSLVADGGQWRIVNKLFTHVGP